MMLSKRRIGEDGRSDVESRERRFPIEKNYHEGGSFWNPFFGKEKTKTRRKRKKSRIASPAMPHMYEC